MNVKANPLMTKSFNLALSIIKFTQKLTEASHFIIANQLLKSGTSVGANIREAQSPESRNDFVHKLKIAAKEADETEYWLLLCKESPLLPDPENLATEVNEIQRMLSASINTVRRTQLRH
jgi:four helix bundle protein